MPEQGTRSDVRHHWITLAIGVRVRTQWEQDHWIAEYMGETAIADTEAEATRALQAALGTRRWRLE